MALMPDLWFVVGVMRPATAVDLVQHESTTIHRFKRAKYISKLGEDLLRCTLVQPIQTSVSDTWDLSQT